MFGRSSSRSNKGQGYASGSSGFAQDHRKESLASNLIERGLAGASAFRRNYSQQQQQQQQQQYQQQRNTQLGDGLRAQFDSSSSSARSFTSDASSYPEKNISISAGTIRGAGPAQTGPTPPSSSSSSSNYHQHQRANPSVGSARTSDTYGRRVGRVDNNVMASSVDRGRRERTFVGAECAVCEEPLEHTLRGERILQFQCTHVSHEACFYEFIREFDGQFCPTCNAPLHLDTSRGGNVIDIEKMSTIVRNADSRSQHTIHTTSQSTAHWDDRPPQMPVSHIDRSPRQANGIARRGSSAQDTVDSDRYPSRAGHGRSDSDVTGVTGITGITGLTGITGSGGYAETTQSGPGRRHDYDVQAMESTPASPRTITRNPIPPPTVTVRSEFPTINRSRQQQTLTCLVTIEVSDSKWRPDPEDIGGRNEATQPAAAVSARADDHFSGAFGRALSPERPAPPPRFFPYESQAVLDDVTEALRNKVDNWHGLDFSRFGKLRLYGTLRVGKDKASWQELECYLFGEMLICVKEKKVPVQNQQLDENGMPRRKCTLKGSILIKKHLNEVTETGNVDENILTLSLSVSELPQFHLQFENRNQLKLWKQALLDLNAVEGSPVRSPDYDRGETSEPDEDFDWQRGGRPQRVPSAASSWGAAKSTTTAPTEYTAQARSPAPAPSVHVPVDVVVVVPISSSMQGVKINLVRDALRFMVSNLGERDRMGLVTFGSGGGGVPVVGMTTKAWAGWANILASIRPVGQKSHRADVVEGANVAMDLLMQRKHNNPIATIMLISDASTSDADSVDFVVSRAEAAKIAIHSFGLGMTHKPDTMIELSSRTKASYTYVKDWMMLRECLAGCLGAVQTLSHQNVKLRLKLPEGSPAKFHKISGALQITKRATGRDAEASIGDLRFGDKRDILVQLVILPDTTSQEQLPQDPWDNIVSGLEALGGPMEQDDQRTLSVEEVPLIQADLGWGDVLRDGTAVQLPRPSLLAITMLPAASNQKKAWQNAPPIPPHPHIVQRRMELLTSDMLTRALTLVGRGQHDRAHTLLNETRSILKGLGKGGLPPVPQPGGSGGSKSNPSTPHPGNDPSPTPDRRRTPSPVSAASSSTATINAHGGGGGSNPNSLGHSRSQDTLAVSGLSAGIDVCTVAALDSELDSALEWISHPAVFGRDSRKAVLQAIGVISSQRGFTFRTPIEGLWAGRVAGVKRLTERSREWREESGEGGIMEEA